VSKKNGGGAEFHVKPLSCGIQGGEKKNGGGLSIGKKEPPPGGLGANGDRYVKDLFPNNKMFLQHFRRFGHNSNPKLKPPKEKE